MHTIDFFTKKLAKILFYIMHKTKIENEENPHYKRVFFVNRGVVKRRKCRFVQYSIRK